MQILLTNDDGIFAPGLAALHQELSQIGDVTVVAPATEQSGVGHSITFLMPLIYREVYDGDRFVGFAVEGSPADCVKLGVAELCRERPQLVVSGINGGLNAGINVLYSGTVAAAIEGAFFEIDSVAVSLEYDDHARFDRAARLARHVIEQILRHKDPSPQLYNLNIPTDALRQESELRIVPMGVARYGSDFVERRDPKGRRYFWATGDPPPATGSVETDLSALANGFVTLTPLSYDMTRHQDLSQLAAWDIQLPLRETGDGSSPEI